MGSHPLLQEIFPIQGLNLHLLHLLHCRQTFSLPSHQANQRKAIIILLGTSIVRSWPVWSQRTQQFSFWNQGSLINHFPPPHLCIYCSFGRACPAKTKSQSLDSFSLSPVLEKLDTSTQLEYGSNYNWITALKYTDLAKKFVRVFPSDGTEKPERTFWATQYILKTVRNQLLFIREKIAMQCPC